MQGVLLSNFPLIFRIHSKSQIHVFHFFRCIQCTVCIEIPCTLIIEEICPDHTIRIAQGHFYGIGLCLLRHNSVKCNRIRRHAWSFCAYNLTGSHCHATFIPHRHIINGIISCSIPVCHPQSNVVKCFSSCKCL